MQRSQLGLFGRCEPKLDGTFATLERMKLDETAWVDYAPGWLQGHEVLFEQLARDTRWRSEQQLLYDKIVKTPRLVASLPTDGPVPPVISQMSAELSKRYGEKLVHVSLAYYRSGQDSVAFHGDRVARERPEALVCTVSIGAPRRFLLRPVSGGASLALSLGWGDLLVMGGSCQRTWQHAIPKIRGAAPRISIMFRPSWFNDA